MSTKKQTPQSPILSLKDAGYKVASNRDATEQVARYVYEQAPDFIDNPRDEIVEQVVAGFMLRFYENRGDKHYLKVDGNFIECKPDAPGAMVMNVHVAYGYTGQQFGKLNKEDPALHGVIKGVRDAFTGYKSDCMKSLNNAIRKIVNNGKTRERGANDDYIDALKKMLTTFDTRALNSKKRGDATADQAKFRLARDAFWQAYTGTNFKA